MKAEIRCDERSNACQYGGRERPDILGENARETEVGHRSDAGCVYRGNKVFNHAECLEHMIAETNGIKFGGNVAEYCSFRVFFRRPETNRSLKRKLLKFPLFVTLIFLWA